MKKIWAILALALALSLIATPAFAVKPNGAQFIDWNLSADVMPVPPYGSLDIPGSDTASKLIVNQPNGKTEVAITGVMNGLNPDTIYTVYLTKSYVPYVETGWSLNGNWNINFNSTKWPAGNPYTHILTATGNTATGASTGNTYNATLSISDNTVTIIATYLPGSNVYPYTYTATGTISSTGTLSGTWYDTLADSGTWYSTSGNAVKAYTGSTGWPGLFTPTVQPFTFTTDEFGSGSWHLNLKDENFNAPGTYDLSVWINEAGRTILISDVFSVVVD